MDGSFFFIQRMNQISGKGALLLLVFCVLASCKKDQDVRLFSLMAAGETGISFENNVPYTEEFNTYTYRNFYNGGGVALGDINNDGLTDIYFTGNITDNRLYLNKGNWKFEDITGKAGVACQGVWSTGATMADVNADGWMDIYVCKAGKPGGENRHNELFINNGDLTFTEKSEEYGLNNTGLSIHASFFDYDRDGDLDCYLLSNSLRSVGGFDLKEGQRQVPDPEGNKLMRNDNGTFKDVTTSAGVYSSKIGYGLGITVSDFNDDRWPDIFISNDFFERDYLYINNHDGTFTEQGDKSFMCLSMGSMGADAADLDNDLKPDLFVTEMLPRTQERKKSKNIYETWDKYMAAVRNGYFHQFSRNVLQKNIGNLKFLEIGRFAGVADTEWSWAALAQDFDNDGLKDLFVSNGIYKDLLDKDYLNYSANATMIRSKIDKKEKVLTELIDSMPSVPQVNCMFKNRGGMHFEMVSDQWGLGQAGFSNGSAYGDLDNDGDLDLVVNNVNMPSFVYRNNSDSISHRSIGFKLVGEGSNTMAIGAKVIVEYCGNSSMLENYTTRGFQSSISPVLHFGVGGSRQVDKVTVYWPDGKVSTRQNLETNKTYSLSQKDAVIPSSRPEDAEAKEAANKCDIQTIPFTHADPDLNLFTRERLMSEMNSNRGPAMAVADVNGDGRDDIFCGGGKNQSDVLWLSEGTQYKPVGTPFSEDAGSESVRAVFFDSDRDGDLDLYVAHGGKSYSEFSAEMDDALYLNDGKGQMQKARAAFKFPRAVNTGDIVVEDLNNDGLPDIAVAEFLRNNLYGMPGAVFLLYNKGNNTYDCQEIKNLAGIGMMTGIECFDSNGDGYRDIIVAGKWMPVLIIANDMGSFVSSVPQAIEATAGLWNTMGSCDVDNDGDMDLICGNEGQNSFLKEGMKMFVNDFDANGSTEAIICLQEGKKYYPIHDPDEMYSQLPVLKKKFISYKQFAAADIEQLFSAEILKSSKVYRLEETASVILVNQGGKFDKLRLPDELQYSSVYAVRVKSNEGGGMTLYAGGNDYKIKPQLGRQDASCGWKVKMAVKDKKLVISHIEPLHIEGPVRYLDFLNGRLVAGINQGRVTVCDQ
jgi:hypothetical protein